MAAGQDGNKDCTRRSRTRVHEQVPTRQRTGYNVSAG
jgi:hypothetical protein